MFTEHKIPQFAEKISDLSDRPNLTALALKEKFDACPEQLRTALNGICDDAKILEDRMDAYRTQTFEGEINRNMLSADIQYELDHKATQTELTQEAAARQNADTAEANARQALASRISAAESSLRRTSYFVTGTYNGSGSSNTQTISIGFQPRAVLVVAYRGYYEEQHDRTCVQLAVRGANAKLVSITSSGFSVKGMLNGDGSAENPYRYLAMA
mgnify:FL=1